MNVPSLQRLTILSFIFHLTFFGAAFVAIKQSARFVMPSPYVVNLVESDVKSEEPIGTQAVSKAPEPEVSKAISKKEVSKKEETVAPSPRESARMRKKAEQHLEKKIEDLRTQVAGLRTAERLADLRTRLDAIKKGGRDLKTTHSTGVLGKRGNFTSSDYAAIVRKEIHRYYETPPNMDKNLVAIVLIKMTREGYVQTCRIKESSGNAMFDDSVLKAVNKASPLTPPPDEDKMEVEVRFTQ